MLVGVFGMDVLNSDVGKAAVSEFMMPGSGALLLPKSGTKGGADDGDETGADDNTDTPADPAGDGKSKTDGAPAGQN